MKYLAIILVLASVTVIIIAISLTGGSVSKSVHWNVYRGTTASFNMYAYQTLYTAVNSDKLVYRRAEKRDDDQWRPLVRLLVMSSIGPGTVSLVILMVFSFVPPLKRNIKLLIISQIVSCVLSTGAGSILGYALSIYKTKYKSLLLIQFYQFNFPGEDSVSTGFYMTSVASALFFISVVINVVSIVVTIKTPPSNTGQTKIGPAAFEQENA